MSDEVTNLKIMNSCYNFTRWQFDKIKPYVKGSVLEVGVGLGNLTPYLLNEGYHGVDINEDHVSYCVKKFGDCFSVLDIGKECPDIVKRRFDTVVLINVLEHVEQDLKALNNIYQMLKPKGRLIIIVPQYKSLFNNIDKADGHYRRYTKKELQEKTNLLFKTIHISHFNSIGCLGWLKNKIFKETTHKTQNLNTFNKIVPFIRLYEDRLPTPIGLSIVLIAQKGNE